jgi:hypothetical protein
MTSSFLSRAAARRHWLITLLLMMGTTATVQAQDREPRSWGVGVEGGAIALDGWDDVRPVVVIEPWISLGSAPRQGARTQAMSASTSFSPLNAPGRCEPPDWSDCFHVPRVAISLTVIPDPPGCLSCPLGTQDFSRLRDRRGGPTFWLLSRLSFPIGRLGPVRSAISAGAGGFYQGGRETQIAGTGTYRTESVLAPAASAGLTLDVALSRRVDLTLAGRGYAVFTGDTEVTTPTGRVAVEGRRMLSPSLTAGMSFSP